MGGFAMLSTTLLSLLIFVYPACCAASTVSAFFSFGDSILDAGNNRFNPNCTIQANFEPHGQTFFHYPTGRFTNGRTVSDFAGELLGIPLQKPFLELQQVMATGTIQRYTNNGVNFASARSGILDDTSSLFGVTPIAAQLSQVESLVKQNKIDSTTIRQAFFFLESGSNDLLRVSLVIWDVKCYRGGAGEGHGYGSRGLGHANIPARARRISLFAVGLVGCVLARVILGGASANGCNENVNQLAQNFEAIAKEMPKKYPGAIGVYGATYDILMTFLSLPKHYGFVNTAAACCGYGMLGGMGQCGVGEFTVCKDPGEFLFWDFFHPSEHTYQLVTKAFCGGGAKKIRPMNLKTLANSSLFVNEIHRSSGCANVEFEMYQRMKKLLGGSEDSDMQLIGCLLSCASRGDRVGLNQMLREGISPNVQDYDLRTALHLAASEGHAPIVELLMEYGADVNLEDRWLKTPLTDARLYGHKDICRILEVNGGKDAKNKKPLTLPNEQRVIEANIDISEIKFDKSTTVEQGQFGVSERVKWRGTWVVKTIIKKQTNSPISMKLTSKDMCLLSELRHPNILQFLGAIVHGDDLILITEYLSGGRLRDIVRGKYRFNNQTAVRYALDIAKGMNYLHQHKPHPIVHNNLNFTNLLRDGGGQLKIGEYWVQMLYDRTHTVEEDVQLKDDADRHIVHDKKNDIRSFGRIFHEMLEGQNINNYSCYNGTPEMAFEPKFKLSRCPAMIQELIQDCFKEDDEKRPTFASIIEVLEDYSSSIRRGCVCSY